MAGGAIESYVNTDDRHADRYIVNIVQAGLGLPDEAYYREDTFAEIRDRLCRPRRRDARAASGGTSRPRPTGPIG